MTRRPIQGKRSATALPLMKLAIDAVTPRHCRPDLDARHMLAPIADLDMAGELDLAILADQRLDLLPLAEGTQAQRQFALGPAIAAQAAKIDPARLRADGAAFQQHDAGAAPGEVIGGADAGNAAADDRHIGLDPHRHGTKSTSSVLIQASIVGAAWLAAAS